MKMNKFVLARLLLLLLLMVSLFFIQQQQQMLAYAQEHNRLLEDSLARKQQKIQLLSRLAEHKTQELWDRLDQQHLDLAKVSQLLKQNHPTIIRRPRLSSRSGKQRSLRNNVSSLYLQIEQDQNTLLRLTHLAQEQLRRAIPNGFPCKGEMTSGFGCRVHPVYGIGKFHHGCDITAPYMTRIFATADGVVKKSEWLGGYGQVVELQHPSGYSTLYAHCQELKVSQGQKVQRGQWIASVGQTGLASGPHCHYEVYHQNIQLDPEPFLTAISFPGQGDLTMTTI